MKRRFQHIVSAAATIAKRPHRQYLATACALAAWLLPRQRPLRCSPSIPTAMAGATTGPVDRRYAQIEPTHVELSKTPLDPKTRFDLLARSNPSKVSPCVRFPAATKGLLSQANGKLQPAGAAYLNMVISEGLSAKPGSRVVVTDVRFDHSRIIFDLDGGPDPKHRFLSHLQVNLGDPDLEDTGLDPTITNPNGEPAGARITLTFPGGIPELIPAQLKALIARLSPSM